jgi:hypothetical protein
VLGGLEEGEQVVTVGQFGLRENDAVSLNHFAPWNKRIWKEAGHGVTVGSAHAEAEHPVRQ